MVAALYRRYRPESFSEMIGQSQVTEPLMTALRNGRVGHAYLFSGPRGCGKTTSARILARCLNCAEGPTDTPCNVCASCIELSRDGGGSLDVVEIDAASHGGVDDARDLRERAVFAPARDRFKIFIIDEAHMVTSAGFNALLKIVEEPPPHVKFVFATTEPEKVIGTIRSRTHHYPFRLIAPGTLIDYMQALCDSEGVQVEPGVLPLVVRAGGGSVRDTLSILDQLIAGSETTLVTADRAAGLLGFTGTELLDEVVTAFGVHDAAAAFRATDRVVQTGQDPRRFVEDLLERLRDLIVVSATTVDGAAAVFRGVPQDQLTRMFGQAQQFGPGELSRVADVTSETLDRMVGATAPRLHLELMIARALVSLDESRGANAAASQAQHQMPQPVQQQPQQQRQQPPASRLAQQPAQQSAPAPQQPAAPAHDPISALAAARNAANEMRQQPTPASPAVQQPVQQPTAQQAPAERAVVGHVPPTAPAPAPVEPAGAQPNAAQPNAAQTAASVRDFLREDPAGATSAAAAPPQNGSKPHPNEGAAAFGRPISAVLSAAQIESIGTEPPTTSPVVPASGTTPTAGQPVQNTPPQELSGQSAAAAQAPVSQPPASQAPAEPQLQQSQQQVRSQQAGSQQAGAQQADVPQETGSRQHAPGATQSDGDFTDDFMDDAEGGFSDLLEVWPDLLEEILEQDRDAWNAVKVVQPLSLEDDVLAVGIASQSDLNAFKAAGAGPLREAILATVGITVRYVPRPIPQGGAQPPRAEEPTEPAAEEPHRAPQTTPPKPDAPAPGADPANDPVARAAARLSALGPALAAPAWADPVPQQPEKQPPMHASAVLAEASVQRTEWPEQPHAPAVEPALAENPAQQQQTAEPASAVPSTAGEASVAPPTVETGAVEPVQVEPAPVESVAPVAAAATRATEPYSDDPYANDPYAGEPSDERIDDGFEDPYASANGYGGEYGSGPATTAMPVAPAASAAPAPALAEQPEQPEQPEPSQQKTQQSAPSFVRYGEAVVRETLGARFVKEIPLAPGNPQN